MEDFHEEERHERESNNEDGVVYGSGSFRIRVDSGFETDSKCGFSDISASNGIRLRIRRVLHGTLGLHHSVAVPISVSFVSHAARYVSEGIRGIVPVLRKIPIVIENVPFCAETVFVEFSRRGEEGAVETRIFPRRGHFYGSRFSKRNEFDPFGSSEREFGGKRKRTGFRREIHLRARTVRNYGADFGPRGERVGFSAEIDLGNVFDSLGIAKADGKDGVGEIRGSALIEKRANFRHVEFSGNLARAPVNDDVVDSPAPHRRFQGDIVRKFRRKNVQVLRFGHAPKSHAVLGNVFRLLRNVRNGKHRSRERRARSPLRRDFGGCGSF